MIDIKAENKEFVAIWVDGAIWRLVHKKRFSREMKTLRAFSSIEELEADFPLIEKRVLLNYVQALLAMKSYFRCEVKSKLQKQKFTPAGIESVLDTMQKYGYLNDEAYKKLLIQSYIKRGYGERLIYQKLMGKLHSPTLAEIAPGEYNGSDEKEKVYAWLKKRGIERTDITALDPKERKKQIGFLLRKGLCSDLVYEILFDF